jgi:hypothetical protein
MIRSKSPSTVRIYLPSAHYEDRDDCLTAAAEDVAHRLGIGPWEVEARWRDGQRTEIEVTAPARAVRREAERLRDVGRNPWWRE